MRTELEALDRAAPTLPWLDIAERKAGAIRLTPLDKAPEPPNLRGLKAEVARRWGTVPLIDVLTETGAAHRLPGRRPTQRPRAAAARRPRPAVAAGHPRLRDQHRNPGRRRRRAWPLRGQHLYARHRYLSTEAARAIAVRIADATFAARQPAVWGRGSGAVASDSTHVPAMDQNLFTGWHARYRGRGVLIVIDQYPL